MLRLGFAIFLMAAGPALAQGCAGTDTAHGPLAPEAAQDWIAPDIVLYAIDEGHGAVRIAPRTGAVTPLGGLHGEPTGPVEISPDKRWLFVPFYNGAKALSYFLEETGTGREIALGAADPDAFAVFAPDRAAVFATADGVDRVQIVDLARGGERVFPLGPSHGPGTIAQEEIPGAMWRDGRLVFAQTGGKTWSLDPVTGARTPSDAVIAPRPSREVMPDSVALRGGARVVLETDGSMYGHHTITVVRRDGTRRLLAETPAQVAKPGEEVVVASCSPAVAELLATFDDGRYLLYRVKDTIWLYGAQADRAAAVWHGRATLRW
ncbi:MAG TPA: hypothetical protein VG387_01065 [Rhizomicrobium sp.]|jgi:hypothetical protein|nr:hypothetical protein [Rhizomicrobium sp.]